MMMMCVCVCVALGHGSEMDHEELKTLDTSLKMWSPKKTFILGGAKLHGNR